MNFLAGGHCLMKAERKKKVVLSSDEYQESDEEPPKQSCKDKSPSTEKEETFTVESIVGHRKVLYYKFKSAIPYQFKVRWLNYGPEDDTYEPIENFCTGSAELLEEYCQHNNIDLPENYIDFMTQLQTVFDEKNLDSTEKNNERLREKEELRRKKKEKKRERKEEESRMKNYGRGPSLSSLFNDAQPSTSSTSKESEVVNKDKEKKLKVEETEEERLKGKEEKRRKKIEEAKRAEEKEKREREKRKIEEGKSSEEKKKEKKDKLKREAEEERKSLMDKIKKSEKDNELERKKKNEEMKKKKEKEDEEERRRMKVGNIKATSITIDELFGINKNDKEKEKEKSKVKEVKKKLNIDVKKDEKEKKKVDVDKEKDEEKKMKEGKEKNEDKEKEVKLKKKEKERKDKKISKNIIRNEKIKITRRSLKKLKEVRRAKDKAKKSLRVQKRIDKMKRIRKRREKAFKIIRSRLLEFSKKEEEKKNDLMKKEIEWRKRMIEEGKMKSIKMINDTIDISNENGVKDATRIRTLRRCKSAERCHNSYLPLSSIYSMETLPICSLYSALDLGLTIEARIRNRELINNSINEKCIRIKKEEEEEKKESINEDNEDSLRLTVNKFKCELISLADKLAPGVYSEDQISIHSSRGVEAYLSLSIDDINKVLDEIGCNQYRNEYIVRLIRLLSSQINLAIPDSPLRDSCDDGNHRKCSMLITLLMVLPEPIRYGKGSNCLLPLNTLYDALSMCAPCQIRAFIRGGCTFDEWIDTAGCHAGHKALRECSINTISWLIERGLDVNSILVPKDGKAIQNDIYIKPYTLYKQSSITMSLCQDHSSRLSLRSSAWTRSLLSLFNIFPITNCHSLNPFSPLHRHLSVTFCDENEFEEKCRIVLAVHSVIINKGDGLIKYEKNKNMKKKDKKNDTSLQDIFIPFFTIERSKNIKCENNELNETFTVDRARIIVRDLSDKKKNIVMELERWKWNESTTILKVPLKDTKYLLSHRRLIEVLIGISSPPEHTVLLSQLFAVVPS